MSEHDHENDREIFDRINALEKNLAEVKGMLAILSKTLPRAIYVLGAICLVLLAVVIYGALGEKGFKAVRETVPVPFHSDTRNAIPWHNDLDKWCRMRLATA